ncbi:MAG TPA: endopeptidase La [Rhodospirillaceae bacterium]|jgi:ATP-dependent Lon protease|nr:endopeptidase La [Alphaproteobacteria bacterium]HBH25862.1 endopeptidase La [Rhodospirillaceae bacterium]
MPQTTDSAPAEPYAVLPLRDIVVFPGMIVPLFIGRDKSVAALEAILRDERRALLLTQKDPAQEDPGPEDLYTVGVLASIIQILKLPDGTFKVLLEGGERAGLTAWLQTEPYMEAHAEALPEPEDDDDEEVEALARTVAGAFEQYVKLHKKVPPEVILSITQVDDPPRLADVIAGHLTIKLKDKQALLAAHSVRDRLERLYALIDTEVESLNAEQRVRKRVKQQMERAQREHYLSEQMKAIQKELAEGGEGEGGELETLEKAIKDKPLTEQARERATAELKKLRLAGPMGGEATIIRNYLDWILGLPWSKRGKVRRDLYAAQKILEADHWGLDKVKERILDYLAVQHRAKKVRGPILCLVGPPGVGKTSLARSIARATGREFVRMSLGGMRDESEIRGHRRTYVGALPGKIIQGMKRAGTANPLFLLDEVDKIGADWRGDPAAAMLEVLDPEQNCAFQDHYLELDYDLSDVMFVCTANTTATLSRPLLDRMEVIQVPSYTEEEKLQIVRRHLFAKQREAAGLKKGELTVTDGAILALIRHYTREAGVRSLEREVANLCRKAMKEIAMKGRKAVRITPANVGKYAGVRRFRYREADKENRVGVVQGLAYTEYGGNLLAIEAVTMPGKEGKVSVTGNLMDVMKESVTVAEMLVKARAEAFGVAWSKLKTQKIHVHVPEGAVPKDGPSAGAAMVTAIVSALKGTPVRHDLAMTGEVNLRGRVTEIGGLKEKLLAAQRGGVRTVLIPRDNEKDLAELPAKLKKALEIIPVDRIEEVLEHALVGAPVR